MTSIPRLVLALGVCAAIHVPGAAPITSGQSQSPGVDRALLMQPLAESWPSYSGDYTGKRYSSLTQIDQSNVKNLTLAWSTRIQPGLPAAAGGRGFGFGGGTAVPTIIGGEGSGDLNESGGRSARIVGSVELAAMDVVEVSPPYDHSDITAAAAHRCVLEAISALAVKKRDGGQVRHEPRVPVAVPAVGAHIHRDQAG